MNFDVVLPQILLHDVVVEAITFTILMLMLMFLSPRILDANCDGDLHVANLDVDVHVEFAHRCECPVSHPLTNCVEMLVIFAWDVDHFLPRLGLNC